MVLVMLIALGGYFVPLLGLAVPALLLTALVMNLRRRRSFCAEACPNGRAYAAVLGGLSRRAPLPPALRSAGFRRGLCGFMLFCVINLLIRSGGGWEAAGRVFRGIYFLSLGVGTALGLYFKPRAWCAVCPVGTLQETLSPRRAAPDETAGEGVERNPAARR